MRPLALAACLSVAFLVGLDAQTGADFTGTWVLETADSATVPQRLVVRQPITTNNARGAPMPPAYLWFTVERWFGNEVQKDSYQIGVIGGVVGGLPRLDGATPSSSQQWSVTWQGNALRMETATAAPRTRRVEVWRLDEKARLVVTISRTQGDQVQMQTAMYRRESNLFAAFHGEFS